MMKLLAVAAEPMEFRGILAHAAEIRAVDVGADWARSARMANCDWLLVANGAGPHRAGAAVDAAVSHFHPDIAVSTGFCGALDPEIGLGEILVAIEVAGGADRFPAREVSTGKPHRQGLIRTIDHIAQTAAEKRELRAGGALAVEMEAVAVAQRSAALGLPFCCVKVTTDLADENLTIDLNGALRSDGHFDTIRILGSTLCRPLVRLPELFRLRGRSVRAARVLGDFFADCRF